jgi:uncharacterized protein (TIGR02453 family)
MSRTRVTASIRKAATLSKAAKNVPQTDRAGFTKKTLPFIVKASRQKRGDWLERNREEYLSEIVAPLQAIARHLKKELGRAAVGYHFPQRGIGRLKRSADSATRYGAAFRDYISYSARRPSASRFDHNPSIFLLVYPEDDAGDEVLLAGGLYLPSSRQLKSIRQAIAADAKPFERLFKSAAFSARFPGGFSDERKSKRPPRGFDPNHPKIEWLKHQGYFVWRSYKKSEYVSAKFGDLLVRDALQILRLNALLEQAIAGRWVSEEKPREKPARILEKLESIDAPIAPRPMDF